SQVRSPGRGRRRPALAMLRSTGLGPGTVHGNRVKLSEIALKSAHQWTRLFLERAFRRSRFLRAVLKPVDLPDHIGFGATGSLNFYADALGLADQRARGG